MPPKTSTVLDTKNLSSRSTTPTGRSQLIMMWILLILALGAFMWSFLNYTQTKKQLAILTDPKLASELSQRETEVLLEKIAKHAVLPKEKNPVVAVINDVEQLAATQDFYSMAHNGDKVVIYSNARKAIIYDEKADRIVNIGPVIYSDQPTPAAPNPEEGRITIELRNGTTSNDSAVKMRDSLSSNEAFNVFKLGKAAKSDYPNTIILDKTGGKKGDVVAALQKAIGGTVVQALPSGEPDTAGEVLVIIGSK